MDTNAGTNTTFRQRLLSGLRSIIRLDGVPDRLQSLITFALRLAIIDLEPTRPLLEECYCPRKGGRGHRDPVVVLRSFILMLMLGKTSINNWVHELKHHVELRVLSGLAPDDNPLGVATFYDFFHRLIDGPWRPHCPHDERPSKLRCKRTFLRNLSKEIAERKAQTQSELAFASQGRVAVETKKALDAIDQALPADYAQRLNEILMRVAVVPSAQAGLLGDLRRIIAASDGTTLPAHADGHGRPGCTCRADGTASCQCLRRYSDPDAMWGWDSHRKTFFFGYRLLVLAARGRVREDHVDLPLQVTIAPANTPDVIAGVDGIVRLHKRLSMPDLKARLHAAIYDAGFDAAAFYDLHNKLGIHPLIALAQEAKTPACAQNVRRNSDGVPLCPADKAMRLHQREPGRQLIFNCPIKRPARVDGKRAFKTYAAQCPRKSLCEPNSTMGPIVRLRLDGDPRMNLSIPRGSPEFRQLFKNRTGTERFNSTFKSRDNIPNGAYRRQHLMLAAAVAHAVDRHADARLKQLLPDADATLRTPAALLAWLEPSPAEVPAPAASHTAGASPVAA
jgi:hypothetical protein